MRKRISLYLLAGLFFALACTAPEARAGFAPFRNKAIDIFPVPVFTTRPDEKESYGLMPVVLLSDKDTKAIQTILAVMGLYNTVIKYSGTGLAHYFPHPEANPDEVVQLYFQWAQKYYREANLRYFNPHLQDNQWYVDASFIWLNTPFRRFYGYGSRTLDTDGSNYVSHNLYALATVGYYIHPTLRVNFSESAVSTDILPRAIPEDGDTLTEYGALPGVFDSTNFIHKFSLTYDTRDKGPNSKRGFLAEGGYFFSLRPLGSDVSFHGFSAEAIHMNSMFDDRTTLLSRLYAQDMYGADIPFYLQSALGGDRELRAFIPNRFIDNGKVIFTWEQRIKVLQKTLFGIPTELSLDPFLEAGSVFDNLNNLGRSKVQTVFGLGIRMLVPPTVVGRIDIAYGSEGYSVYTQLGYPF